MYVVVIGMGQVGRHVVRTLEWEKHDVVAVDNDPAAIAYIEDHHDVMTLTGYGASQQILQEAKAGEADLVVAVTDTDEVNLIAALAAKQMGARRVVARVQSSAWSGRGEGEVDGVSYGLLGVDVVFNPRVLLAQEIHKISQSHGALEVIDLANERIEVVQMELGEHGRVLHKTLAKLNLPNQVLVGAVVRDDELFVPGGADVLLPGDRVYLIGHPEHMVEAEDHFSVQKEAHKICIVGGGVIGESLARQLLADRSNHVTIIELDRERATTLAGKLPRATIVSGDGTDVKLLEEQRVGAYDLFAAVTHEDEVNLMAALLARRIGSGRTCCIVHRPDYAEIYRQLGIDVVLSPRVVASDHILRYCRATRLQSLTVLEDGKAEVLEILASPSSRVVDQPVKRLSIPRGAIIAAILKSDRVVIPHGGDIIEAGDTVVVLCTPSARPSVAQLFRERSL